MQKHHTRGTREIHAFAPNCKDKVEFWDAPQIITASVLTPGVASAAALSQLNKLGCWLAKYSNSTSLALSDLLLDVDSIRHATLQNRAAIDFLLLAYGHGCQDFDGHCCMNLSDHYTSMYAQIQELQRLNHQLVVQTGWNPFAGWTWGWPWLRQLILGFAIICLVFLCIMCFVPCIIQLIRQMIDTLLQQYAVRMVEYHHVPTTDHAVTCVRRG